MKCWKKLILYFLNLFNIQLNADCKAEKTCRNMGLELHWLVRIHIMCCFLEYLNDK